MAEQDLAAYFEDVTRGRSGDQPEPWLVITYGPAGAGKLRHVQNFLHPYLLTHLLTHLHTCMQVSLALTH